MMQEVLLSSICDLKNGFAFKSKDYVDSSNTLSCRMSSIRPGGNFDLEHNQRFLPDTYAEVYSDYLLKDGDIVIAMTDLAGDPKILGVPTIVNTGGKKLLQNQRVGKLVITDSSKVFIPYLQYALNRPSNKSYYKKFAGGGLQINVSKKDILNNSVPLPPIDQQKKIAAILDAADAYRQKTKALIEKYDALTQSLFLDMFGDPLVNSKNWATEQFGNEMQNGIGKGKEHYGSGTKVANIGDLYTSHDFKPVKYSLLDVSNKEINKYCLKYGDLLFVRSSLKKEGVAVCSFYNSEETCLFSSFMIKASPKLDILNPYFLSIQMRTPSYRIYIVNAANTATITNISQPNLKELNIIIPPMDLQNQFAERVQAIEAQKAQAQASLAQAEDLFNSLLQRSFKGELL